MEVFEYAVSYAVDARLSDESEIDTQKGYVAAKDMINAIQELNEGYGRILKLTIESLGSGRIIEKCKDNDGVNIIETSSNVYGVNENDE